MDNLGQNAKPYNYFTDAPQAEQKDSQPPRSTRSSSIKMNLRQRTPSSRASNQASSDDTPLFMAKANDRGGRKSLFPISKRHSNSLNRQSDPVFYLRGKSLGDDSTWAIMEREIFEWQNICATGRPSWWSPISYWNNAGISSSTWRHGSYSIPPWRFIDGKMTPPDPKFEQICRAVTDNYIADNNHVHELAQLVAIQLLSACFTLPQDQLSTYKSTGSRDLDKIGSANLIDSQLISSLRMHTESRYMPAFGHQARNTSLATLTQGVLDSTSPAVSPEDASESSAQIRSSKKGSREGRSHPPLNSIETSAEGTQPHNQVEQQYPDQIGPRQGSTLKKGRHRLGKIILPKRDTSLLFRGRKVKGCQEMANGSPKLRRDALEKSTQPGYPENLVVVPRNGLSLQGISWSEPYPVFLQPLGKMLAKRWQAIRRRFSHSLSEGYPDLGRTNSEFAISKPDRSSTPMPSLRLSIDDGSPRHSSDRKERRRRARERGDIHGSSMDSSPRYNTPTGLSPTSPACLGPPTLYRYADLLRAVAIIASESKSEMGASLSGSSSVSSSGANSPRAMGVAKGVESSSINASSPTKQELERPIPLASANTKGNQIARSQRGRRQSNRRSYLSEVYTPDESDDRNLLSALGSALASQDEIEAENEATVQKGGATSKLYDSQLDNQQRFDTSPLEEVLSSNKGRQILKRPRLSRVSSSGTQRFTPSEDGVEVDGLPAGPTADVWVQDDNGKGLQTRSFL